MNAAPTLSAPIIELNASRPPQAVAKFLRKWNRQAAMRGMGAEVSARYVKRAQHAPIPHVTLKARGPKGSPFLDTRVLVRGEVIGSGKGPRPVSSAPNIGADGVKVGPDVVHEGGASLRISAGVPADFSVENVQAAVRSLCSSAGLQIPFEV